AVIAVSNPIAPITTAGTRSPAPTAASTAPVARRAPIAAPSAQPAATKTQTNSANATAMYAVRWAGSVQNANQYPPGPVNASAPSASAQRAATTPPTTASTGHGEERRRQASSTTTKTSQAPSTTAGCVQDRKEVCTARVSTSSNAGTPTTSARPIAES